MPLQLALASGEKGASGAASSFVCTGQLTGADNLVGPTTGGDSLVLTLSGASFNTQDWSQNRVGAACCP